MKPCDFISQKPLHVTTCRGKTLEQRVEGIPIVEQFRLFNLPYTNGINYPFWYVVKLMYAFMHIWRAHSLKAVEQLGYSAIKQSVRKLSDWTCALGISQMLFWEWPHFRNSWNSTHGLAKCTSKTKVLLRSTNIFFLSIRKIWSLNLASFSSYESVCSSFFDH